MSLLQSGRKLVCAPPISGTLRRRPAATATLALDHRACAVLLGQPFRQGGLVLFPALTTTAALGVGIPPALSILITNDERLARAGADLVPSLATPNTQWCAFGEKVVRLVLVHLHRGCVGRAVEARHVQQLQNGTRKHIPARRRFSRRPARARPR